MASPGGIVGHLSVDRRFAGEAVVVRAVGEVDVATAGLLGEQLEAAAAMVNPPAPVVADLRDVEFFGSNGVAVLFRAQQLCEKRRTALRVVAGRPVTRPLVLLGLQDMFIVYPTLAAALGHGR